MVDLRNLITEAVYSSRSIDCADAILAAMDAAGLVVVPREPTEEMRRAFQEKMDEWMQEIGTDDDLYTAMIAASPYAKKEVE